MNFFQTYTCGHGGNYVIQKKVKPTEATAILKKVFGKECDACRGVNSSLSVDMIERLNNFYGLPELQGTEGQIHWANNIRLTMYEKIMSRYALKERLAFLIHVQMIVHAEYWIKNRLMDLIEFNEKADNLYDYLRENDTKYKKLTYLRTNLSEAETKPMLRIVYTGEVDRYVVKCGDYVFGLYKFKEEAEQGMTFIEKQLDIPKFEVDDGLPF